MTENKKEEEKKETNVFQTLLAIGCQSTLL
jgi:hypothetical protein